MPLYVYECPNGDVTEQIYSIEQRRGSITCGCGARAHRIVVAPVVHTLTEYFDINLANKEHPHGQVVKSYDHRRRILKDNKLFEYGPSAQAKAAMKTNRRKTIS